MIIPILHCEKQVQLKDLTRFDASHSCLVKGSVDAINAVKIKAGADASYINVFSSNSKNWYLDYAFTSYKFDVDSSNNKIQFDYNGSKYTIAVVDGTYTLNDLMTAIETAIETEVPTLNVSFTVDDKDKINVLSNPYMKLYPRCKESLLKHLGFSKDGQTKSTPVEYGIRKVELRVESNSEFETLIEYVEVYTENGDALYSEDSDLVGLENDIMKWLPLGKGSYKYLHRKSQKSIIDWLDRQGYRDDNGDKFIKFAFVDNTDVRMWSIYATLKLFFTGANNATDDVFKEKYKHYHKLEIESRDRAVLNLDFDGDGEPEEQKNPDIRSGRLYFR